MTRYFHFTPHQFLVGSYLPTGNFGKLIRFVGQAHPLTRREMAYEAARPAAAPSRLDCLFCLPTLEECALYRRYISAAKGCFLFELETAENGFVCDQTMLQHYEADHFLDETIRAYWRGWMAPDDANALVFREVLLRNGACVVRQIPIDPSL